MKDDRLLEANNRLNLVRYWITNAVLTGDTDTATGSLSKALEDLVAIEVMVRDEIRSQAVATIVRTGKQRLANSEHIEANSEHIEANSEHIEANSEHIEANSEHINSIDRDEVS